MTCVVRGAGTTCQDSSNIMCIYAAGVILVNRKKTLLVVNRTRVVDDRPGTGPGLSDDAN